MKEVVEDTGGLVGEFIEMLFDLFIQPMLALMP